MVSPDDSADLPLFTDHKLVTGGIYVGVAGDVVAVFSDNSTQLFSAQAGFTLPLAVRRINATNTTATGLIALYVV